MPRHPLMTQSDFSRPFVFMTDASDNNIGAVLAHYDDGGHAHLIACIRWTLRGVEKPDNIRTQEAIASYRSVAMLRDYLCDTHLKVGTDHQNTEVALHVQ